MKAEKIMEEIKANGPVFFSMNVYADFKEYHEGIYKRQSGSKRLGGHAVKAIGYGYDEETSTPFWVVANSWGVAFGEEGFFRIAMN